MALEELAAIGVVANDRENEETDDHAGVVNWGLKGADGEVIADVFEAFRQTQGGWDETWIYTSPSPPIREEEEETTQGNPTLRPTPEAVPNEGLPLAWDWNAAWESSDDDANSAERA
jgi:hypothetical protein